MARYKTKVKPRETKKAFPIWMMVTGIGLILVALWAFLSTTGREKAPIEVTNAPGIRVDQESFNYGDVKLGGKPIQTVVQVTNVGDQNLEFTEAPYIEVVEGC